MKRMHPAQRGFAAVAAIFLVVVLAALGAFMLTFSNTQHLTSAQDVQGSRAYWAARAGLEWGIGSVSAQPAAMTVCPMSPTTLPAGSVPFEGGFTAVVTCKQLTFNEAGEDRSNFSFTSVAHNAATPGTVNFIERSLSASIEK